MWVDLVKVSPANAVFFEKWHSQKDKKWGNRFHFVPNKEQMAKLVEIALLGALGVVVAVGESAYQLFKRLSDDEAKSVRAASVRAASDEKSARRIAHEHSGYDAWRNTITDQFQSSDPYSAHYYYDRRFSRVDRRRWSHHAYGHPDDNAWHHAYPHFHATDHDGNSITIIYGEALSLENRRWKR